MANVQAIASDKCRAVVTYNDTNSSEALLVYQSNLRACEAYMTDIIHDKYVRELFTYYVMGLGGMTMCCFGLIGNAISLIVLCQKAMRSSTYTYLAGLAVCDILVLMFTTILLIKDVDEPVEGQQRWPWDALIYTYMFPFTHAAAFTFQVTSVWLTLAFTVDRYIMICHPFQAEPYCTIGRARRVLLGIYLTGIIFNIPKFFEYKTVTVQTTDNVTRIGCDLTSFGKSDIFRQLYHSWFYIAFVCCVPFVSLAVLNAFLIHAVHLSRRRGREMNPAERKRNDTTIMLISVVVVFFICQMPALVSRTIWAFEEDPNQAFRQLPLFALNEISSFLIILNSAINIVPYYFFGKRFRKHFWRLFCCCILRLKSDLTLTRSFSVTALDRKDSDCATNDNITLQVRSDNRSRDLLSTQRRPNLQLVKKDCCLSGCCDSASPSRQSSNKTNENGSCAPAQQALLNLMDGQVKADF